MTLRPAWAERLRLARQHRKVPWSQLRAVRELEQKAADLKISVPGRESLLRMLKGWERGDHIPSYLYRSLWSVVFDIPECVLFADLPPVLTPSGSAGGTAHDGAAQLLTVSIAIVLHDHCTLLVCRRDAGSGSWQFPAGVVKPGADPAAVAVAETLAETGVHCSARSSLGRRLHPVTRVICEYYRCDYLAGSPENLDQVENAAATWVPRTDLTRFIPAHLIYPPVLQLTQADR